MIAVKKCHPCQVFTKKIRAHLTLMFPVIVVDPFSRWGIDFTTCTPVLAGGHKYIIVVVDYFTKWVEAMPTIKNDGETTTIFIFNQVITRFGVPWQIVTDHGTHFENAMMKELAAKLDF